MSILFFISCLLLVAGWYEYRRRQARKLIRDLREALEKDQDFLFEADRKLASRMGIDDLLRVVRVKMEERAQMLARNASQMEQIETTFRNMREGVLVLAGSNQILVANRSAEKLLNEGRSLNGRRVERFIHHPTFLDFIREVKQEGTRGRRQIEVDLLGKEAWLEISGAPLDTNESDRGGRLSLFLFNDISRLKKLEAIRRDFVANVSHELRTPVTILKGFSQTLVDDADRLPPEKRKAFIEKIHRSAERLHALVEDLLALSSLESREFEIVCSVRDVRAEINAFLSDYRPPTGNSARLQWDLPAEQVQAKINPGVLQRVLTNLADNAFKHGETNTYVEIFLRRDPADGLVEFGVRDDGNGIPEKARDRIFQRFYRLDKGRSSSTGSTGLGLSIVRHSMLSMGGRVRAEPLDPKGTEFICVLPAEEEADENE